MVTIALKSEALFAIIGVGAVFVTVCVAVALCYTFHRRKRRSKEGGGSGKEVQLHGQMVEDIALTVIPARARSSPNAADDTTKWDARDVLPAVEVDTKIEASATLFSEVEPPAELPTPAPLPPQPRFSQSTRLDPELFQQTFSTYESFYRAQSETSASVPSSPDPRGAASSAWPSQPAARTRTASRLTNVTLADIALPSTPTKLSITSTLTGAPTGEPDHAPSVSTPILPPPSRRARRSMSVVVLPPAAASPRQRAFHVSELPPSPRPIQTAGARGSPGGEGGRSALASRPRSRSVGASTIPPPAYREVHGAGKKNSPAIARSRSAAVPGQKRSLDGGPRLVGDVWLSRPVASTAASNISYSTRAGMSQPRSYFDD